MINTRDSREAGREIFRSTHQTSMKDPMTETVFANARLGNGQMCDITVSAGRIQAMTPHDGTVKRLPETMTDLGGRLVLPGFTEGHVHLDTSFYGGPWVSHKPCTAGFDVHERVAFQHENMAVAEPMDLRARKQLELCIANGTTSLRSHVMVDGAVGLRSLETILEVREAFRDLIDVQVVAFPQSGILKSAGTAGLLDEALHKGADLIGGLDPGSFDRDVDGHLDVVFGLAEKHGAGIDIHLHDGGSLGIFTLQEICNRTVSLGMQGHVAVSHAYALGDIGADEARRTGEQLARSGVSIMTNAPGAVNFPPVALLRAQGVTVFGGSDNIRDSWWPYGDGDMLGRAMMIGYRSGFYTDAELEMAFDVVTTAGARALNLEGYGLSVGCRADFVVLDAAHVAEAVVSVPRSRCVYKSGRLVARNGSLC
jgi:cytosine/creatinine deaminase